MLNLWKALLVLSAVSVGTAGAAPAQPSPAAQGDRGGAGSRVPGAAGTVPRRAAALRQLLSLQEPGARAGRCPGAARAGQQLGAPACSAGTVSLNRLCRGIIYNGLGSNTGNFERSFLSC